MPTPSQTLNLSIIIALIFVALISPVIGTHADFSSSGLTIWSRFCILAGVSNFGMMALQPNSVWIVGLVFSILTYIFTEVQIPIRSAYMERVADNDPTRYYLGAMRQFASYSSQVSTALSASVHLMRM